MKKVLFTATVDSHILAFHTPYLKYFKEQGYEVHVATNGTEEIPFCDVKHVVSFERSPFKFANLKAIKQLKRIVEKENFDIIHCHTPMGGVVTRLASKKSRKKGTRVIYTAHGFHFFKGAPIINWALFYPVEKYLSKYTDTLITINKEDYELAKNKFKKCKQVEYVPGVGIDEEKFDFKMTKKEKSELRKSLGLKDDDFVIIYPAEISNRKRHVWLINTLADTLKKNSKMHLLLPGRDSLNGKCQEMTQNLDLSNQIHFLGFRTDIPKLLTISNIAISSARQEGLPVNVMEAMYVGLPIVASDCRGNRDLVCNNKNGYLVNLNDNVAFVDSIEKMYINAKEANKFGEVSKKMIEDYLLSKIKVDMVKIYLNKQYNINKNLVSCIKKIRKLIQLKFNKFGSEKRNRKLKNKNLTIISNNCFAGITYEYLNLPYLSPTIGLYFFSPEYIKFINRLKYYVSLELEFVETKESKYYEKLKQIKQENVIIGKLGDVEIVFLHYSSFNEAREKWKKRCKRINYDNIMFKFNDQNECTTKELEAFNNFDAKNKICFTAKKYNYYGFVSMPKYKNKKSVIEDVFYYHKYINIIEYINNMKKNNE